jgi:hypothetical protein
MGARVWLCLAMFGCSHTHTRYVTPWLRTSVDEPVEIIAESGGPKTRTWIERKRSGRWERVSTGHGALRISDDRALYELCDDSHCEPIVAAVSGETVRLPDCDGWIVMPAGSSEIVCVNPRHTSDSWKSENAPDHANRPADGSMPVDVVRYDVLGRQRGRARATLPPNAMAGDTELQLIGVVDVDPAIAAVERITPNAYRCTLWRIRDASVERGDSISATNRDACLDPAIWRNQVAGLTPGGRLETTNGHVPEEWW